MKLVIREDKKHTQNIKANQCDTILSWTEMNVAYKREKYVNNLLMNMNPNYSTNSLFSHVFAV